MSLPHDPDHLMLEVDNARNQIRKRRERIKQIVAELAGDMSIAPDGRIEPHRTENKWHEYLAVVTPRIVGGDPRVRVSSASPKAGVISIAGEAVVNQWIADTLHRTWCRRACTDYLLGYAVATLRMDGKLEDDDEPSVELALELLDGDDAWWDATARHWERKRFSGFSYAIDHDELIERATREKGWNLGLVKRLPVDSGLDEVGIDENTPHRNQVVLREIWVPDVRLPKARPDTNGTVFTLAITTGGGGEARGVFPREPRPYFGPPWGPLYLYDAYHIPGQALGMSPCEGSMELVDEIELQSRKVSDMIRRKRTVGIADQGYAADAQVLNATPDGEVAFLDGFDRAKFTEATFGGADAESLNSREYLEQRWNKRMGMNEALTGQVGARGLATEQMQAYESAGVRLGDLAQRFSDCDEKVLRGVLWFYMHTRALRMKVDATSLGAPPEVAQQVEVEVQGGPTPGVSFEDVTLSLERYSMRHISEGVLMERAQQGMGIALQLAQIAPQIAGFADVSLLAAKMGDALNWPGFERFIDANAAAQMGGAQMAMESEPGAERKQGPRLVPKVQPTYKPGAKISPSAQLSGNSGGQKARQAV